MLVSGRNNVKEILKNFTGKIEFKRAICQENFNEKDILDLLKKKNIQVFYDKKAKLDSLVKNNHQGIILEISEYHYAHLDDLLTKDKCFLIILDHLEDPHNLGAIIRTCEAASVDGIIIPINRSVSVNETVMKTSVGTLYNVPICQEVNLSNTIKKLKKNGFFIYGADMDGVDYNEVNYPDKVCLVIGNEGNGLARIVRESCDEIVSIPMSGRVNSLNASVACGILIYKVIRR